MNKLKLFLGVVLLLALFACKSKESEYHSLNEKIEKEGEKYHKPNISSKAYLNDIKTVPITEGNHHFSIPERKSQITSYACTECHSQPLTEMQQNTSLQKAHWEIKLVHADENIMNCVSCHNGKNMDNLNSLTAKSVDFNESYKLCSQCHNSQFEDWKGGAHGKNIGGWAEPRVAMTCVNCHNPHQPQIAPRWPSRFNTQKVKERE